ncbi:hypothetical protein D3C81_1864340 [compost metagenome]
MAGGQAGSICRPPRLMSRRQASSVSTDRVDVQVRIGFVPVNHRTVDRADVLPVPLKNVLDEPGEPFPVDILDDLRP